MGNILTFLKENEFDVEATRLIGDAYDAACAMLHDKGQPGVVQEIIAKRIIAMATTGEREPKELARRALKTLGLTLE